MSVEIEAKLKVDSLEPIAQKLKQIGAIFGGSVFQTDHYFDDTSGSLAKSDKALRLRCETREAIVKTVLAYKGPREAGAFKRRQEVQFDVDNGEQAAIMLASLGFAESLVIQKRRKLWWLEGCEIALDELPQLGMFVEIEGPSEEKITDVQSQLGLADRPHIKEGYAILMQKAKSKG
ncbi:MAG: class IV adenylate cyclase [Sedimentisphaerales bacterium]|nr:class IV adenylate cyclase [Sedimentisphaerales bacterium]